MARAACSGFGAIAWNLSERSKRVAGIPNTATGLEACAGIATLEICPATRRCNGSSDIACETEPQTPSLRRPPRAPTPVHVPPIVHTHTSSCVSWDRLHACPIRQHVHRATTLVKRMHVGLGSVHRSLVQGADSHRYACNKSNQSCNIG